MKLATDIERRVLLEAQTDTETNQAKTTLADSIISAYEKRIGRTGSK